MFVCLVTRAIHLELVRDNTANEFLLALSRFTSRRGVPKFILSDNGANFHFVQPLVGPTKPIRIADFKLNQYLSSNSIQWSFIPALAPWFGGAYERLIRIVKSFGFVMLNLLELQTVLCQAEDVMNSRPISYIPSDVIQPLLPNHFLQLRTTTVDTQLEVTEDGIPVTARHLLEGWRKVHATMEHYWSQFHSYLLNLRQFHTTVHKKQQGNVNRLPVVGEVVLIKDPSKPKGEWNIGKIVKVDKNQATAAILLLNKSGAYLNVPASTGQRHIVQRSIRLLCPLELNPVDNN